MRELSGANKARKAIHYSVVAILFIVVAIFVAPPDAERGEHAGKSRHFLLAMAMAALGLTTHVSALKSGAKGLLMALVLFAWLIVGGGAINYVIESVIA
ncbi:putative sulfate exporter family transporter [Shigella flexneri]